MHIRCDNRYKSGADRGNILGQTMLFECMGICVFSPAHECEMRSSLVYLLIVKYSSIFFKFSYGILDMPYGFFMWIKKNISDGSVDHNIYRACTMGRSSFIYCSLACCYARANMWANMVATVRAFRAVLFAVSYTHLRAHET